MAHVVDMAEIEALARGRYGKLDVPCPWCGPERRAAINQRRPVLRIWRFDDEFASFCCARCGESGYASRRAAPGEQRPARDPAAVAAAKAEREMLERAARAERLGLARWLWQRREPAEGSPAERYLRARGYQGAIPATLGFLPAHNDHPPAMVAGFGLADEPEPGVISLPASRLAGVHLTKLAPDGSAKAGTEKDKVMIGYSRGAPIVLAPMNDLLGLAVAEGIEKGLAVHQATGLGVWVAGAASRMPSLADAIPDYADCVSLYTDDDKDGRRHAAALAQAIKARGIHVEPIVF